MKSNLEIIKKLFENKIKKDLFFISLLAIIAGIIDIYLFYIIGNLFSGEIKSFEPNYLLLFLLLRLSVNSLLEKIRSHGIWKFYQKIAHKYVKNKLEKDYWYQKNTKKSTILRKVVKDIPHVSYIYQSILNIINDSVFSIVIISVLVYYEPVLILSLIISFTVISYLVTITFKKRIQETALKRLKSDDDIKMWIISFRDSVDQLFSLKKTNVISNKLNNIITSRFESGRNQTFFVALTRIITENILLFIIILFLIFYSTPNIIWILPLLIRLIPNISRINTSYSTFSFYKNEVLELLNRIDKKENKGLIFEGKIYEHKNLIEYKIQNLGYKGQSPVVQNKNITIPLNKIVFIVGKSGIGKSTLGKFISESSLKKFSNFILLPQKVSIFPDTLKFNVSLGTNISDYEVKSILQSVGMKLDQTRLNLEYLIDEENLSGGQMQRIALARTISHGYNNFILDEPTNNLDASSKKEIIKSIKKLHSNGSSIIVITHDNEFIDQFENSIQIDL